MTRHYSHNGKQVLTAAGWHIADANSPEMARRIAEAMNAVSERKPELAVAIPPAASGGVL